MEFEYANVSVALFPCGRMGGKITGWCYELGNRPSPQPSPHGRGSPVAAVVRASPLPWGEGQGEGSDARYVSPHARRWKSISGAAAMAYVGRSGYIGVIE